MWRVVSLAVVALATACGPSIKPAMQQATDALIGSYSSSVNVGTPKAYTPREWKAGQWIAFRTAREDGPPSVSIMRILEGKNGGFIVETEVQDYYGRTLTQAHYKAMPQPLTVEVAMEALEKIVTQSNEEPVQEIEFASSPMGPFIKSTMKYVAANLEAPSDIAQLPKESVSVPAGTFKGAAKYDATVSVGPITRKATGWFHPAVPINGTVKTVDEKGYVTELLAFGESGAQSALK